MPAIRSNQLVNYRAGRCQKRP